MLTFGGSETDSPSRRLIRNYLRSVLILSALALAASVPLHWVLTDNGFLLLMETVFVLNMAVLFGLQMTLDRRSTTGNLVLVVVSQWAFALVVVVIEPWAIHFTPLVCLGHVLFAVGMMSRDQYRTLSLAAIGFIGFMTVVGRVDQYGPVMADSPTWVRNVLSLILTPLLFVLVSWICWESHNAIWSRNLLIGQSHRRLVHAEELGRRSIERESAGLRLRLSALRDRLPVFDESPPAAHQREAARLLPEVQQASTDLRQLSHGVMASARRNADGESPLHAIADLSTFPVEVVVADDIRPLPEVIESTILNCAADIVRSLASADVIGTTITLADAEGSVFLTVEHRLAAPLPAYELPLSVSDRVGALAGTARLRLSGEAVAIEVRLPLDPRGEDPSELSMLRRTADRTMAAALRRAVVFPLVGLAVAVIMWQTILPYAAMRDAAILIAVVFTVPGVVAALIGGRWPEAGAVLFAGSYWTTAIAVATRLDLIKFFAALGLLIPVVALLPHLGRVWFGVLVITSAVVAAISTAISRLGDHLEITSESPFWVNALIVVVMVAVTSAVILTQSRRNHASLAVRSAELRASRRRVVEATDRARRRIERDLHDGAQQRLVSAAVRLQILGRLDAADHGAILRNRQIVEEELMSAESALRLLERPADRIDDASVLADRLEHLSGSAPIPVDLRLGSLMPSIPGDVATAVWFCCSEALGNVVKHAGEEARATVDVGSNPEYVRFSVSDTGRGFEWPLREGVGLRNLSERVALLGGSLDVTTRPGSGTRIVGSIPLSEV